VFSTKARPPILHESIRGELYAYLAGALRNLKCPAIKIGGTADHMHVLCLLSKNLALARLVEEFKTGSSKWLKTKGQEFQSFHWQGGYGGFSVGESGLEAATRYIERQEEHHRKMSFQDEYRKLLEKYRVPYDERFVWD
jgi:REP element-mobilizing transposase RayT